MITNNEIKFIRSLSDKGERYGNGLFVAEGEKLIAELLAAKNVECHSLYRVGDSCSQAQMERMSLLKNPSSVLAVLRFAVFNDTASPVTLVLDGVQDPGNLGTIIRTADWFGIRRVVCSADCADVYSPKVVQSTMGAIARVEVVYTDLLQWIGNNAQGEVYGTFLERSEPLQNITLAPQSIIVMGSEGQGISPSVERLITRRVRIERGVGGDGESLNVAIATAIVLWATAR